ncbi:MAG: TrbC/VirB2 family protein [Deltaproteobacteria bacterium]|nr:TrbC/VirB2 family protein [Deltaproteobacteria bacterium]
MKNRLRNFLIYYFFISPVLAFATDDPFAPTTEKITSLTDYLTSSNLMIGIGTLVIIVCGMGLALNFGNKMWLWRIIGFFLLVVSAGGISKFFLG